MDLFWENILEKIRSNLKGISRFLLVIVVFSVLIYSYISYQKQVEMNISEEIAHYETIFSKEMTADVMDTDWLQSLVSLEVIGRDHLDYESGQRALYMVGLTYYKKKDYLEAKEIFKLILEGKNTFYSALASLYLASILEDENPGEAIILLEDFRKQNKKHPFYFEGLLKLAMNYISIDNNEPAIDILNEVISSVDSGYQRQAQEMLILISIKN